MANPDHHPAALQPTGTHVAELLSLGRREEGRGKERTEKKNIERRETRRGGEKNIKENEKRKEKNGRHEHTNV